MHRGRRNVMTDLSRRTFLGAAGTVAAGAAVGPWVRRAHAQGAPLKIGLVLPYSGVYAVLGESITQAMELVFARENWTVAGRKIELIKEDDEMQPPVGIRKTEKLIESDKVDILTGPVHSGILMGMRDKVHNSKTILIVSNAGADAISRERCSKWIFRTSFSNWQPSPPAARSSTRTTRSSERPTTRPTLPRSSSPAPRRCSRSTPGPMR